MSSATSTETRRAPRRTKPDPVPPPDAPEGGGFRPWHFFVAAALVVAGAGLVMAREGDPVAAAFVGLTVATTGIAGVAAFRMLLPLVDAAVGEGTVMLAGRTRAALERDKMLTLRAIKELEFDRAMGKVSEADFSDMLDRLRARALRLMRQLEGGAVYRQIIDRDLEARLGAPVTRDATLGAVGTCAGCGTVNDHDARFCKMCGAPVGPASGGGA